MHLISKYQAFSRLWRTACIVFFFIFMISQVICHAHVDLIEIPNSHHDALERMAEEREAERRHERVVEGRASERDKEKDAEYQERNSV